MRWSVAAAALLMALPRPAAALWDEQLELFVAQGLSHDENLFRLGPGLDPEVVLGVPARGDSYWTTSAGVELDVPVRAQRFVGHATLDRERYDRFTSVDFDGHSVLGAWIWTIGDRLDGRLSYLDERLLGSFGTLQGGIQSRAPNLIDVSETVAEAGVQLAPRWEARAELASREHENSAAEFRIGDAVIDRTGWTFNYVARSGNRIGFNLETIDGDLPQPQLVDGLLVDNSYDQTTLAVLVDWTLTDKSRLDLSFGRVDRDYAQPGRGLADWVARAAYEWRPTGKLSLTAVAERDISGSEEINVGYVFAESLSVQPTLSITDKIDFNASVTYSYREYGGDPGLATVAGASVNEDVTTTRAGLDWAVTRLLTMSVDWQHRYRDSNLTFADYDTDVVTIRLRAGF